MWPFQKREELPTYAVTLELSGKHPYRTEAKFQVPDHTATVNVHAKSWDDAAKQALCPKVLSKLPRWWSAHATKIERT